jgi:hypothetical protein
MSSVTARPIETPAASQYPFQVAHFGPVADTRKLLASVPRSKSISATSYVHMYASGNLLHVRVLWVSARGRDFDGSDPFVFGVVAGVGHCRSGRTLFWSLSMELVS